MKRNLKRVLVLVSVLILVFLIYSCRDFLDVDQCLDRGGCWDYSARACMKDEPDSQERCDRSNPYR